ncbi:hypothetical protein RHMOL_Rhmol08G0068300 [Rhododendron molle]|uniref:Uncharacterized protein n=1 Tax=Rhododendron molle TaxID=49168 RepID=A0ACC0MM40_RHOML|nr:hypothetical protein RHMOL_Rhmol08G0068300 [Rhododendron molle]
MGAINSELEELFEAKKRVKNPYVPIGTLGRKHSGRHCMPLHFCFANVGGAVVASLVIVDLTVVHGGGSMGCGSKYGALITAGVLTAGLISFRQGNSHLGQQLMRARVVAQGATVALMGGTAYYYGDKF